MASTDHFTICKQSRNEFAYTNCVYVNPNIRSSSSLNDAAKASISTQLYVKIGKCVFTCQTDPLIQQGCLAFNLLQRKSLGLEFNDQVDAQFFTANDSFLSPAKSIIIEFEIWPPESKQKILFKENELIINIRSKILHQAFVADQWFWGKFDIFVLTYRVTQVVTMPKVSHSLSEKSKSSTSNVEAEASLITHSTNFHIVPSPAHSHHLFLEPSSAAPEEAFLNSNWSFSDMGIGGLDVEFGTLFRRAFASRMFPSVVVQQLGIKHVKGLLLYGPPGTGKTLIARQIGKLLKGKEPKIVNGPEILNKFVGESEKKIRDLFVDADKDEKTLKDKSPLHVIIFDEIDAICKTRSGGGGDQASSVGDNVVAQLLSKIDGIHALNNVLVIGMTNRKDMLDPALLRPGRLEMHLKIGLPDTSGREQILNIHTQKMRDNGRLDSDVNLSELAKVTKNFSGAELEGLIKSASSFALYNCIDLSGGTENAKTKTDANMVKVQTFVDSKKKDESSTCSTSSGGLMVNNSHFQRALIEIKPSFGSTETDELLVMPSNFIIYSPEYEKIVNKGLLLCKQMEEEPADSISKIKSLSAVSLLLIGPPGSGKTTLAAKFAKQSKFPFVKIINPKDYIGRSDTVKCLAITKIFDDARQSPSSLIILDDLERLLEYSSIGPRFNNQILQTLLILIKSSSTCNKTMIIATSTGSKHILQDMEFEHAFDICLTIPLLTKTNHLLACIGATQKSVDDTTRAAMATTTSMQQLEACLPLTIKRVFNICKHSSN